MQARIGPAGGVLGIDTAAEAAAGPLARGEPVQALPLDVGAHADRAELLDEQSGEHRFPRPREPAREDERPALDGHEALGEPQVVADLALRAVALGGARGKLVRAHAGDLRPDHRAVHEIEAEAREPGVVAGLLEVGVEEPAGVRGETVVGEIHDAERDLAHDVDPAQVRVELDAVERHDAPIQQEEVAQVQVAMALAHEALAPARGEDAAAVPELALGPCGEPLQRGRALPARAERRRS